VRESHISMNSMCERVPYINELYRMNEGARETLLSHISMRHVPYMMEQESLTHKRVSFVRCSVLQRVAVSCSVLQCAVKCGAQLCIAQESLYCAVQCVAVCCSVLQCVAVCCSVLQCVAVCCSVL